MLLVNAYYYGRQGHFMEVGVGGCDRSIAGVCVYTTAAQFTIRGIKNICLGTIILLH